MSAIFLKRFLQRPFQVASIIPSSRTLIRRVADKMDLTKPRVIVEYGPGEGCHTREIVRRMHPDSQMILFELDPELAEHGHAHCDYIVSGIPFSILDPAKKRALLRSTFDVLAPHAGAAFIIYQVTNELVAHCRHFSRIESQYCLQNLPPMFVTKFYKTANGSAHGTATSNGKNGQPVNGHSRH